eukprot:evm.model.NODE_3798_length_1187_cov_24.003370.1
MAIEVVIHPFHADAFIDLAMNETAAVATAAAAVAEVAAVAAREKKYMLSKATWKELMTTGPHSGSHTH